MNESAVERRREEERRRGWGGMNESVKRQKKRGEGKGE